MHSQNQTTITFVIFKPRIQYYFVNPDQNTKQKWCFILAGTVVFKLYNNIPNLLTN